MAEFYEYPLLSYQDLMLTVLKVASRGRSTLDDCLTELRRNLTAAHEHPPVGTDEITARLNAAKACLVEAALIERLDADGFTITGRGRQVLDQHPMGVDDTVLMEFAEFRRFIRRAAAPAEHDDPRSAEFEEGLEAYRDGKAITDNPYEFDQIQHLAWENGWFSARDEDRPAETRSRD